MWRRHRARGQPHTSEAVLSVASGVLQWKFCSVSRSGFVTQDVDTKFCQQPDLQIPHTMLSAMVRFLLKHLGLSHLDSQGWDEVACP